MSLLNFLPYHSCFMFWLSGRQACGIATSWPGMQPTPFALEGKVWSTGLAGKCLILFHVLFMISLRIKYPAHESEDQIEMEIFKKKKEASNIWLKQGQSWIKYVQGCFNLSSSPGGSAGKESACSAGDPGSIPGSGRSAGGGKGCPLQHSGLENSTDRIVHGVPKSRTRLSDFQPHLIYASKHLLRFTSVFPSSLSVVSRSVASDSLWPHGLLPTRLLRPRGSPGKRPGLDCHFLLQGISPTGGLNLGLLHCRQTLFHLSQQGSPLWLFWHHLLGLQTKYQYIWTSNKRSFLFLPN